MALPIYVPLLYVSILVGSLLLFSRWHRNRKQAEIATTEPWFPMHKSRDLYISLLDRSTSPSSSDDSQPAVPEKMLMSALLLRAQEDVHRIHRIRDCKMALSALLQTGSLGEETQARFTAAEKEMEAEVVDVVSEANAYRQGWGSWIFASANEMVMREKIKDVLGNVDTVRLEQERIYKLVNPNFKSSLTSAPFPPSRNQSSSPLPPPNQSMLMPGPNGQQIVMPTGVTLPNAAALARMASMGNLKRTGSSGTASGEDAGSSQLANAAGSSSSAVAQGNEGAGPSTPARGVTGSSKNTPSSSVKKKGKRR